MNFMTKRRIVRRAKIAIQILSKHGLLDEWADAVYKAETKDRQRDKLRMMRIIDPYSKCPDVMKYGGPV